LGLHLYGLICVNNGKTLLVERTLKTLSALILFALQQRLNI
jgi:hypothetical protein